MSGDQERVGPVALGGVVAQVLRASLQNFVSGVKLYSVELSLDIGPFSKSLPSFAQIGKGMLERFDHEIAMMAVFRTHVKELDDNLNGLSDLRRRFDEEVVQVLAAADVTDEQKGAGEARRVGTALLSMLRAAELELKTLEYSLEETTTLDHDRGKPVRKAVVSVDLWHYSELVSLIESAVDVYAVDMLNQQIENLILDSVRKAGPAVKDVLILMLGDGAIILFDNCSSACKFTEQLHRGADDQNLGKRKQQGYKHFRVGVRRGEVVVKVTSRAGKVTGFTMAGMAVCEAVRLQAKCRTGEMLICADTWAKLPEADRPRYSSVGKVQGKHPGESIDAFRRKVVDAAEGDEELSRTV